MQRNPGRNPGQSSVVGLCGSRRNQLNSPAPDSVSFPLSKSDIIRYYHTKIDCRVDVGCDRQIPWDSIVVSYPNTHVSHGKSWSTAFIE